MAALSVDFFGRDTEIVARELLGQLLVKTTPAGRMVGRIVEAEAYHGPGDAASHAGNGVTPRSAIMFGPPGIAYVYLNYGVHCLLNVVTERDGVAGAVLMRALEPVEGLDLMRANRPAESDIDLTSGPGKLTKAMGINLADNGRDITTGDLALASGPPIDFKICSSSRVGVRKGADAKLRFYVAGSRYVSRGDGLRAVAKDRAPTRRLTGGMPVSTPGSSV